jgi:Protein kinase domain
MSAAAAPRLAARSRFSSLVLDIAADQNSGEIKAGGVLVWKPGCFVRPVDATSREILTREAERLILRKEEKGRNRSGEEEEEEEEEEGEETTDVEIDENALIKRVRDYPGSRRWARYVARLTNLDRPEVVNVGGQPEMLFQQLVFPPVVGLLYCFNTRTYKADDVASSGFCCTAITPRRKNLSSPPPSPRRDVPFTCKPDAAALATPKYLALATMEVKNASAGTFDADDLFNCVLLTSITAMAVVERCSAAVDFVMVPFVVNEGEEATLYAATMHKDWKAPVIKKVLTAHLHRRPDRVNLIAHLAVLLHWLTKLVASPEATVLQSLLRSVRTSRRQRDDNDESQSATRSSRGGGSGDGPNKKARQGSPPTSGGGGDNAVDEHRGPPAGAFAFASCEGRVTALVPFRRRGGVRDSPVYFWAEFHDASVRTTYTREDEETNIPGLAPAENVEATAGPVFVKVWREDDSGTSRRRVETEVELLRAAHRAGVPCPGVISELTQLSVPYNNRLFHRLVMQRLANDPVEQGGLCLYARSLVAAVLRLHRAGLLHCDIKPSNVVWDATAKAASLVDFGHAQEEDGATAYPGTAGYTSPEVERHMEPHSRRSDAYSVGKTLGKVCDQTPGAVRRSDVQHVLRVASRLAVEAPGDRITLEDALRELASSVAGGTALSSSPAAGGSILRASPGPKLSPDSAVAKNAGDAIDLASNMHGDDPRCEERAVT